MLNPFLTRAAVKVPLILRQEVNVMEHWIYGFINLIIYGFMDDDDINNYQPTKTIPFWEFHRLSKADIEQHGSVESQLIFLVNHEYSKIFLG